MPSAQKQETGEPFFISTDRERADLHSLLHAVGVSNIGHLTSMHGREKVLYSEGEPARGVYILRTGRATVSMSSSDGRIVILRMAQPGDVLGLNSVLRNGSYDMTLKTLDPCRTDFISRTHLIELMEKSHAGAHAVLTLLSRELTELTDRTKSLLLSQTAAARIARLLLEWCKTADLDSAGVARIDRVFTHEQLAQMICSSRETVTRLLASLSRRNIIQVTSNSVLIRDRAALEEMAQS